MSYFSSVIFVFFTMNAYAMDFDLKPGAEDIDGTEYYTLVARNPIGKTNVDVALEGNSNTVKIRDRLAFTCAWGEVEGVKVEMSSRTDNEVMTVYSYYFFDEKLSNVFSKSFFLMNEKTPYTPLSLNYSVCDRNSGGVKKDSRTGKDYIENYEAIVDGPFVLKGVPNVRIKYVISKGVSLIKESKQGDVVVDHYENKDNLSPVSRTLFFMDVSSVMNVVSLISWGGAKKSHDVTCYKVYAYTYDNNGDLSGNDILNNDVNLSGCEGNGNEFSYKNAIAIKEYINKVYGVNN